jgi:hypothetical protein
MRSPYFSWRLFGLIDFLGCVLVFIGASESAGLQVLGLVLLVPGSAVATFVPTRLLWHPILLRCCGADAEGLSNVLFLPTAVLANASILYIIRRWRARTVLPASKQENANSR